MRIGICALLSALLLSGCSEERAGAVVAETTPQAPVTGEATVLGFHIQLFDTDPCRVQYSREGKTTEVRLVIPPPCTFHRDRDGTVRVQQVNNARVILVERSTPDREHPGDCDTRVQAIIISPETVRSSAGVERVAMCAPFRWDDVMFIGLAESGPRRQP